MERWVTWAWLTLVLVHAAPAAVVAAPSLVRELYGVSVDGATGVLLVHRGALFLAVVAAAAAAAFDPDARRAAAIVVAISIFGYVYVYFQAGMPGGEPRTVAVVDASALAPLVLVIDDAWHSSAAEKSSAAPTASTPSSRQREKSARRSIRRSTSADTSLPPPIPAGGADRDRRAQAQQRDHERGD